MNMDWRITPAVPTDRPTICGAVMGAATVLGYTIAGGRFRPPPEPTATTIVLPFDGLLHTAGQCCLHLQLFRKDCRAGFGCDDAGRWVLYVSSPHLAAEHLANAGRELAGRIRQQAVYHHTVIALRQAEFTILERDDNPEGGVGILARLPARQQTRTASRTAHPQFRLHIDSWGDMTIRPLRLALVARRRLARFLDDLCAMIHSAPAAEGTGAPHTRSRPAPQGHAA